MSNRHTYPRILPTLLTCCALSLVGLPCQDGRAEEKGKDAKPAETPPKKAKDPAPDKTAKKQEKPKKDELKIVVRKPSKEELKKLGVESWAIWEREPGPLPWTYESKETCYILAGEVTVEVGKERVSFGPGDLVIFPKGLSCVWKIKKAVKKHYLFEEE